MPNAARASAMAARMRSRRVLFASSSTAASAAASSTVAASSSRAASSASPTRPAALSLGARTKPTVSRSTLSGRTLAFARRAAIPGRGAVRMRSRPSCAIDRFSPRTGTMSETVPMVGEVGQLARLGLRAGQLAQEQARDRERDARSRQPSVGIDAVVALRVDEGDRRGQDLGQVVVVGDDDVDPARRRRGDLRDARGPGVDRHDQRDAVPRRGLDRRQRQAVPLLQAAGDVRDGVQAEPPEGEHELGEAGQAIGIEVAEHHDPLAALDGAPDARDQAVGVGQQPRVVQPVGGGAEEPGHRGRIGDAASREDRGRERPEAQLASRRADHGIEVERLREHPAVTRVDHRREDATSALRRACPDGRTVAGAGLAGSPADRIGSRPRPGPTITWRVGGLGEPRARRRAAGRPADATRRAAGRR